MTMHTFQMTEAQAELVHKVVASHTHALKNWIATAVEGGKLEYAQELVQQLREYEALFAGFNMEAKRTIDPTKTDHLIRSAK